MSEKSKKKASPKVKAKTATLWTGNAKNARNAALTFTFSEDTVQKVNTQRVKIKSGDEEVDYKASFSKGILSKLIG